MSQEIEGINESPSNVLEREQIKVNKFMATMPSEVGRTPIELTGTDIEGNQLAINVVAKPFLTEGESLTLNQAQRNLNKREVTSISVNSLFYPESIPSFIRNSLFYPFIPLLSIRSFIRNQ